MCNGLTGFILRQKPHTLIWWQDLLTWLCKYTQTQTNAPLSLILSSRICFVAYLTFRFSVFTMGALLKTWKTRQTKTCISQVSVIWAMPKRKRSFFSLSLIGTHLVPLHSSWHSNQVVNRCHRCWSWAWQRCSCLWWRRARMSQHLQSERCHQRRSHSSSPSRSSRRHPWLSGGRRHRLTSHHIHMCHNHIHNQVLQCQMQWIVRQVPVLALLLLSRFCLVGRLDSYQGSLVR